MTKNVFLKKTMPFVVLAFLLTLPTAPWAAPVDGTRARKVAVTFLQGVGCKQAAAITDHSAELPFRQFYLFAADEGGFVLVAADDCAMPIVGYSATGHFATQALPAHISDWLKDYEQQITCLARQGRHDGVVAEHWDLLLKGSMPKAALDTNVDPLLTTTWNQSPYYNEYCPIEEGGTSRAVAGCTAIATAQVMKYWNYPKKGYGSFSYTWRNYGTLSAHFDSTTYKWSQMPGNLTSSTMQYRVNAVATLVYHVGVAVKMQYSPDGSGAWTDCFGVADTASAENALRQYFKYKGTLHHVYRADLPADVYDSILRHELDNSRPIIYDGSGSGGGHAFVLDGYDTDGLFHVNWGWGGYCDGYYALGALDPVLNGRPLGYGFNKDEGAMVGVEPNYDFDTTATTTVTLASNNTDYGTVTGSGTYGFGDTVTMYAKAAPNCRFVRWSDYSTANNRQFLAMGGDYTITAIFEPLSGDTLGYAPSTKWVYTFGSGNDSTTIRWGIRLPAAVLTPGHSLTSVQAYVSVVGDYRAAVFFDTMAASVVDKPFSVTNDDLYDWKTIALDTSLRITGRDDVYIFIYNTGIAKPIALTYDGGNDNELLLGGFDSTRLRRQYSAMVRGIFALDSNTYTITVAPNNDTMGSVSGGGTYAAGTTATLTATPADGFYFNTWSDGVTDNPRTIVVAEDVRLEAIFSTHEDITSAPSIAVALYPNPTSGQIHIDVPNIETVCVFDQTGRKVAMVHHSDVVDLSELADGIYTLHIILPQGCVVKKVVKTDL